MRAADAPAATRWHRLVTDRLEEMERLVPGSGCLDGTFWDKRADRSSPGTGQGDPGDDPFLRALLRAADGKGTALDVGAGRGRFALPLAADLDQVTAVDPSKGMLSALEREAADRGLTNITTVRATWDEAQVEPADIAFSSFVLTLVPDAPAFVEKLEAHARRHAFLYLGTYASDGVLDPLWRHFHDVPRVPGASYIDALDVLREMGIEPEVKLVETPNRMRFATAADAVDYYRDGLLLPQTQEVDRELEELLGKWLLGRRGAFRSPLRSVPAAILRWAPRPTAAP